MARKTFRGAAADLTLANSLTSGTATIQCNGDTSGWPDGADGNEFVLQLEPDTDNAETVLCATLTAGAPSSIAVLSRGWDGTAAVAHSPNVVVRHVLDADTIDDLEGHVYDPARDDHGQYLNQTRHDVTARHQFGPSGALGVPGTPADISDTASTGAAAGPARADHVHAIPAVGVTNAMLAAASVDSRVLAPGAIVNPLAFAAPCGPWYVSDTDYVPTSGSIPDGFAQWKPTLGRLQVWKATPGVWVPAAGAMPFVLATSTFAGTLGAGFTFGTLGSFSSVAGDDPDTMISGGNTWTVKAGHGGIWSVEAETALESAAGTWAAGLAIRAVQSTVTTLYNLHTGPNAPAHSTVLSGSVRLRLKAGDTLQVAPAQDSGASRNFIPNHRFTAELRVPDGS